VDSGNGATGAKARLVLEWSRGAEGPLFHGIKGICMVLFEHRRIRISSWPTDAFWA